MTEYRITKKNCNCHPETCSHWGYYLEGKILGGAWRDVQGSDDMCRLEDMKRDLEKKKITTKFGDTITYTDSPEVRDAVFARVMKYFVDHGVFFGESIHQMDNPIIDAPNVMSDIADKIMKFVVEDQDELIP